MKTVIIDASVILRFLLDENLRQQRKIRQLLSQAKRGKVEIYSSPIFPLEVGNGLRYSLRSGKKAVMVYQKFLALPIRYQFISSSDYLKIFSLAQLTKTTVYDASYHFLAFLLNGVFWTADEEHYQKAKKLGKIILIN